MLMLAEVLLLEDGSECEATTLCEMIEEIAAAATALLGVLSLAN